MQGQAAVGFVAPEAATTVAARQQKQQMAQGAAPQFPLAIAGQQPMPQQQRQHNQLHTAAQPLMPIKQNEKGLRPPIPALMPNVADPQGRLPI